MLNESYIIQCINVVYLIYDNYKFKVILVIEFFHYIQNLLFRYG